MKRVFFDWSSPFLPRAAAYLAERKSADGRLDFSETVVALPSSRAMHRLEKLLAMEANRLAESEKIAPDWIPPTFLTVGKLPELLYPPRCSFASSLLELFIWQDCLEAFRRRQPEKFAVLFPHGPEETGFLERMELAAKPSGLHRELASDGVDFSAAVRALGAIPEERRRWEILAELENDYLAAMDKAGFWDTQTARIRAVEYGECRTEKDLYLVGAVDLNRTQKRMIEQTAERSPGRITFLVFAPEERRDDFDPFGGVIPQRWETPRIPVRREKIHPTANPADEGELAARLVAETRRANGGKDGKIAVGVADEEVTPFLELHLAALGVPATRTAGTPAPENRVIRLLSLIADFLTRSEFSAMAALVRHPDMEAYLTTMDPASSKNDALSEFDRYQNRYVPERLGGRLIDAPDSAVPPEFSAAARLSRHTLALLDVFFDSNETSSAKDKSAENAAAESIGETLSQMAKKSGFRPLRYLPANRWPEILSDLLDTVYPDAPAEPTESDRQIDAGLILIHGFFDELSAIPETLSPRLSGEEAIRLLLRRLSGKSIAPPPHANDVELTGWLDLALDDRPELIVTGLSEGFVPESRVGDLFLPDSLRRRLGLEDNLRRFARDAWMLSAIIASRPETAFLFARRSLDENPRRVSRLLLAVEPEEIAKRLIAFSTDSPETPAPEPTIEVETDQADESTSPVETAEAPSGEVLTASESVRKSRFTAPVLRFDGPSPTKMRVTDFQAFLGCPYRYFLRRHLGLERLGDSELELGANLFGDLAHETLCAFGRDESIRDSVDAEKIAAYLDARLKAEAEKRFAGNTAGSVLLQIKRLGLRLRAFADWQAAWRAAGNRICFAEIAPPPEDPLSIEVDGEPMTISGRIDRIDWNDRLGVWTVFDYKTDESPKLGTQAESGRVTDETQRRLLNSRIDNCVEKKHRARGKKLSDGSIAPPSWTNLQLPLYRHLVRNILRSAAPDLPLGEPLPCYIMLPKSGPTLAFAAPWSEPELTDADNTAAWVIRTIRRLWHDGVDPTALLDPSRPDLGRVLNAEAAPYLRQEFAEITGP